MRIGIYGYGNLGKACEEAISLNPDMKLVAVFTRRDPKSITLKTKDAKVFSCYDVMNYINRIDVMINCGSSATDLPATTSFLSRHFNVVDCFDNHEKIKEHFINVDNSARESGNVALISAGCDPGLFSIIRLYFSAFFPGMGVSTFQNGLSQGHSEVIKHIHGVCDARQYTVPDEAAVEMARKGETVAASMRDTHKRMCYVSARDNAYPNEIEDQIKSLPGYFLGYDTTVSFVGKDELEEQHSSFASGENVIACGKTDASGEHKALVEINYNADSSAQFTAGILVAGARAVYRAYKRGEKGCRMITDIAPADLSPLNESEIRSTLI